HPPETPVFLTPVVGSDRVILSWDAVANATGYSVEYRTGSGAWVAGWSGAKTKAIITGLTPETEYEFRLKASNADGDSGWATIAVKTKAVGPIRIIRFERISVVTPQETNIVKGG
ncbi:MAG: fibronectin type III domain-containing protein, partial [Planctomycetaceae bacterium]|nr:fibronectin type III domain-containing protein [Planctomycetaceae bacterium]